MKIAVIGGGIYGTTVAIKLAEAGYKIDLYEKEPDILQAASGINQYRLHRGYHYPRSAPTAISSNTAEPLFIREYREAIIESPEHYYSIAKEGSKVTGDEFISFCNKCDLEYEKVNLEVMNIDAIEFTIKVKESLMNPLKLRQIVGERLRKHKVNLFLNTKVDDSILDKYDIVINATYANLNFILDRYPEARREYQFEVCEKLVLKLPKVFEGKSIVVLDGPFMCIDPYDETGFHVMGNVVYAIHKSNTGLFPEIPNEFKSLLNKGIIKNPPITNFKKFIEEALYFMPKIDKAEHIGSMYTVRTVLPNVDKTDERPTFVYRVNNKIINIFSGKVGNSVQAAVDTLELVEKIKNGL